MKKYFSQFSPSLGDLYSVLELIGQHESEISSIFGISCKENEQNLLAGYNATKNAPWIQIVYYHRLVKAFWYRDYDTAYECCEKYHSYQVEANLLRVTDLGTVFFTGLCAYILCRKKKRTGLASKGDEELMKLQAWKKFGSEWNAENKALLLEAESNFAQGDMAKARDAYEMSIESAHKHKFLHEEALAHELFGIFCVETGDSEKGNELLDTARNLYMQWGAKKKADSILPL